MPMPGLTVKSLKHHKSLIPLHFAIVAGTILGGSYLFRLATRHPEVSWNRSGNPEPWNKVKPDFQYKFLSHKIDYKNLKNPEGRPEL